MTSLNAVRASVLCTLVCCAVAAADLAAAVSEGPGEAGAAANAPAGQPLSPVEIAKQATEKVFGILRDPKLRGDLFTQKRYDLVRKVADDRFDWPLMARGALGRHWNGITKAQQEEFTELFSDLIVNTYLSTIERNLDAKIRYEGQDVQDELAKVKTIAVTGDGTETPVVYWLKRTEVKDEDPEKGTRTDWLVYNVQIEGVSMVTNYRSQFNDIIVGSSYDKLLERLKAKVADAAKARADLVAAAGPAEKTGDEAAGGAAP